MAHKKHSMHHSSEYSEHHSRKRFYDGDYSGNLNHARRLEREDFDMIHEDHSAPANLPQDVKYHAWPKSGHYADFELDDTIRVIDEQERADGMGMRRFKSTKKY